MDVGQRDLLRKWIMERQYANVENSVVSMVIDKCLLPKREREKTDEGKAMRGRKRALERNKEEAERERNRERINELKIQSGRDDNADESK